MADILSVPVSAFMSFATIESKNYSRVLPKSLLLSNFPFTHSEIFSIPLLSQIPSHPNKVKYISSLDSLVISGFDVIICYYADNCSFCFHYKSPKALVKFKHPLTRP